MLECNFCKNQADQFFTSANDKGEWDLYCATCYSKFVLDNYDGIIPYPIKPYTPECECGTKNAIGQGHSYWCQRYKRN